MYNQQELLQLEGLLEKVSAFNEDTEYDPDDEILIEKITKLAAESGEPAMVEDFATPYLHPMQNIQKWVEELKVIVAARLRDGARDI